MAIELTQEQMAVLKETAEAQSPVEFQALLEAARPEMDSIIREVMEPNQPIQTTIIELRDLYLSLSRETTRLAKVGYDATRRGRLRDGIRLLVTADLWFGEGQRTGAFRTRPIEDVIEASRPWRARLKAYGDQAFFSDPDLAELFGDVNSTGTLDEEKDDLRKLNEAVAQHREKLEAVGMAPEFVLQGRALFDEVDGRGLQGILGVRSQEEASGLRNRILTYATLLGREGRAAGVNACFDDPEARRRFEAASFRDAVRRLRPRKKSAVAKEAEAKAKAEAEAKAKADAEAKAKAGGGGDKPG